jgi:hypothetical protein
MRKPKNKDVVFYTVCGITDTIADVARKITEHMGIAGDSFYLVLNGKNLSSEPYRRLAEYDMKVVERAGLQLMVRLLGSGKRARTEKYTKDEKLSLNKVRLNALEFDPPTKIDVNMFAKVQNKVKELTTNMDEKWFSMKLESMPPKKVAELYEMIKETKQQEQCIPNYVPFFVEEHAACEEVGAECAKAVSVLKYAFTKKFIQHFYNNDSQQFQFKPFCEMVVDQHKMNDLIEIMAKRASTT